MKLTSAGSKVSRSCELCEVSPICSTTPWLQPLSNKQACNKTKITNEPRHEISNNVVCATSKGSEQPAPYAQSDQNLC